MGTKRRSLGVMVKIYYKNYINVNFFSFLCDYDNNLQR